MSGWRILHYHGGDERDILGYRRNVKGTPVCSARKIPEGSPGYAVPMAGVYRYVFETSTEVSCAGVGRMDYANPLVYPGVRSVIADGVFENLNLLPGWAIVAAADTSPGDIFEIGTGCLLEDDMTTWHRVLSFGPRLAGYPSAGVRLVAKNASGVPLSGCMVTATNAIRIQNQSSPTSPFLMFWQSGPLNPFADDDPNGVPVSFGQYSILGHSHKYAYILVNGEPVDIHDVAGEKLIPGGGKLVCDGTTVYRFADGSKHQSGTFVLAGQMASALTATLHVSDAAESVRIGHGTGSVVSGAAGLILPQDGEEAGRIAAGGSAAFEVSINPTERPAADLDARSFSLRLSGMDGDRPVCFDCQGSFIPISGTAELNLRIDAVAKVYARPHYSKDPGDPGNYIPDEEGLFVEDEQNPGTFILAAAAPDGGYYGNYADYLSTNGIRFINA
ncbi:MAG: hypothetical protein V1792_12870 [Pseudomonadota bacterium]